jgi:lipid-binding SYLF domain-containing protein
MHPIRLSRAARAALAALALAAGSGATLAQTQPPSQHPIPGQNRDQSQVQKQSHFNNAPQNRSNQANLSGGNTASKTAVNESDYLAEATGHLNRAIAVLHQMGGKPELAALLARSKGVFVVPDAVNVAVGVGVRGGAGVLLVRRPDGWGTPAFYNMGSVTAGPQLGAESGGMVFVLNDQKALDSFARGNKVALNADAGLTLVDWSKKGEGSAGLGNITVWTDTEGLFAGAAVNATNINFDDSETAAYYKRAVAPAEVLAGRVPNPHAAALRAALASADTAKGAAGVGGRSDGKTRSGDSDLAPSGR